MLSRDTLNALLPEGFTWTPAPDGDYDHLLEGVAENTESIRLVLDQLRYIRDPYKTPVLSDLEADYGILAKSTTTEAVRRRTLAATMFRRNTNPTYELLEEKLQSSGFDVFVHANDPAVDPDTFLDESFNMTCGDILPGGNDAQCGEPEAICARVGGELLVNGEFYIQQPNYTIQCDESLAQCGEPDALAGQYDSINLFLVEYDVPTDSGYWPLIFFVGGEATRDPVTGAITSIDIAPVPTDRRTEFRTIILRYKPLVTWAALIVVYS